ncbi:MAG: hypothetical protein AAGF58_11930 [Pseudomonadota bacterium]
MKRDEDALFPHRRNSVNAHQRAPIGAVSANRESLRMMYIKPLEDFSDLSHKGDPPPSYAARPIESPR